MEKDIIQWHPAFCSAMRLEFIENKDELHYDNEYNLNRKPIQIDLLVIKKSEDVSISNEIGRIFKGHNIMEYKSPGDDMNVDTYFKALAYASLYKAGGEHVDEIKADDITISLVREEKPRKLMEWLKENGYAITTISSGIYHVHKDGFFDTQIIVSGELSEQEHQWLTALTRNLQRESARRLVYRIQSLTEKSEKEFASSVLDVAVSANQKEFGVLRKEESNMYEALLKLMEPEVNAIKEEVKAETEARVKAETEARVKAETEARIKAEAAAEIKEKDSENQRLKDEIKKLQAKLAML